MWVRGMVWRYEFDRRFDYEEFIGFGVGWAAEGSEANPIGTSLSGRQLQQHLLLN
jgi:hypothetical protein